MLVIALYLGRMCRIGIDLVWVDVEKILIVMAMIFFKVIDKCSNFENEISYR